MKNFGGQWTRAEAVKALFFPDLSAYPAVVGEKRMCQLISIAFEGLPLQSSSLSPLQQQTLQQAVQAVETSMPHLTASSLVHSILWARWALHSPVPHIANAFWLQFAHWRATKKPSFVRLMQHRVPGSKLWRGRVRTSNGAKKLVGYTLDQILSMDEFPFNEYKVEWRIKVVRLAAVVERTGAPRGIENVCGQETMRVLGECIRTEAESCPPGLLSPNKTDGKYTCTVSPAELLERLKSRYPAITRYKDSTLTRGLSAFVRCPRGRPGGHRHSSA